jgi:TPP-dependent pyruvate/acetoin dehydrogenase alpha subunit
VQCRKELLGKRKVSEAELKALEADADKEIAECVRFSLESPWPDPKYAIEHVYAGLNAEDWQ